VSRRVLHSCGLTVVAAPAGTDCTIRLENVGAVLATAKPWQHHADPQPQRARAPGSCASG